MLARSAGVIRELVVADDCRDFVRTDGCREGFGAKVCVEQHYVGTDQRRPEDGLHEAASVATQDAHGLPRFDALAAELDGE